MIQIPAVTERCAGIDVGKRGLAVARAVGPVDKEAVIETRWFGTTVPALRELETWLREAGCTTVAMESTGSYWVPVKNILEGSFQITLVNARKHRPKKGQKTDFRDAIDLAVKHRHGLLTGSFMPERGIVELRDLTRRRKKLCGVLASEKNRIQKVLETANVKFGSIASDVFGVSGQNILQALLGSKPVSAEDLAQMAQRKLRNKIPELREALEQHQLNDHHRWLIQQSIDHAQYVDRQMEKVEAKIEEHLKPYRRSYELLMTIPGVKEITAAAILAEIGPDMSPFPSAADLGSWAGICPGNNRSAGKSKSSHIKRANKFLTAALVEAGWGAARKQGSAFRGQFTRWVKGLGKKKANIAICHSLLRVIYAVLKSGQPYRQADTTAVQARQREYKVRHHARLLVQLGADPATVTALVEGMFADRELVKEAQDVDSRAASPLGTDPQPTPNENASPAIARGEGADLPCAEQAAANSALEVDPPPSDPTEKDDSTKADRTTRNGRIAPRRTNRRIVRGVLGFRIRTAPITKDEYSDFKERSDTQPSPARSRGKQPKKKTTRSSGHS